MIKKSSVSVSTLSKIIPPVGRKTNKPVLFVNIAKCLF